MSNTLRAREEKQKILIVDDSEMNRSILADILEEDFEIIEACDGVEAVNHMRSYGVELSLVLLDIVMPRMDGFAVLTTMNSYKWIQDIPVIMISAESSSAYMIKALELGATDYIQRPFDAMVVRRRVLNTIMLYAKQRKLVDLVEQQIYEKEKEQSLMINILSHIVEFRNGESGLHVLHIHTMTEIILQDLLRCTDKYKITQQDIGLITTASALHDIGKIAIDDKILNKPGRFTPEEYEIMKKHSAYGADMLANMPAYQNEPLVKVAKEICRWHHERYDGKGYPDGLVGDEIPISAQVVALADVYDALTSERVYKPPYSHERAIEMISNGECGTFNPILIEVLNHISDKIQSELRGASVSGQSLRNIRRVTQNVIAKKELGVSNRTLELLEREREKYRFIASLSNELLFEVYLNPTSVNFMDEQAAQLGVDMVIDDPLNDEKLLSCTGKETLLVFRNRIMEATHDKPVFFMDCDVKMNGSLCHCRISAMAQFDYNDEKDDYDLAGAICKLEDISKDYARLTALERAATNDGLTGLYNHAHAKLLAEHILNVNPEGDYVLVMIDLDDFKGCNDNYGHMFGDEVLKSFTAQMQKALPSNGFAARIGGDEFMIFWEDKGSTQEEVDALFNSLKEVFKKNKTSASMGIATTKDASHDFSELFRCADTALYTTKENGKGAYLYYTRDMKEKHAPAKKK